MATNVTTTAKNKKDVDEMTAKERTWDSLSYAYGQKQEQSNKQYDKAISQQDRALLGRGMQRSSYGMNTLNNLRNEKVNAYNDIDSQKIADYENRLYQIDRDEIEDAFKREQMDESKRQFDENLAFQKSESERSQGNWEKEYEANRADTEWNQKYQQSQADFAREQWEAQQAQWREEFDYNKMSDEQKLNYNYVTYALENGADVSDELLAKAGLSRDDFNAMKAAASQVSSSGGYYKPKPDKGDEEETEGLKITDSDFFKQMMRDLPTSDTNRTSISNVLNKTGSTNNAVTPTSNITTRKVNGVNKTISKLVPDATKKTVKLVR